MTVSRRDLTRVALWGLVLQASYDTVRRQALGICASMTALSRLWPGVDDRRLFLRRHLEPMNTNPAMAGFLLGTMSRFEERAAAGEEGALLKLERLRRTLEGPLAAAGDAIFWAGLRPLGALLGAVLSWFLGGVGPVVFLLLYNTVHLGVRVGGVFWGYDKGERVHEVFRAPWLRAMRALVRWGLPLCGLLLVFVASNTDGWADATVAPAAVTAYILGRRGTVHGGVLAGGAIMVGLILALAIARVGP